MNATTVAVDRTKRLSACFQHFKGPAFHSTCPTHIHTHTHMYTYTHTCTHTHPHTHTHTGLSLVHMVSVSQSG